MQFRIGAGWSASLPDLQGSERRFWISAYVTEPDLNEARCGDRVLLRGIARDFAYRSSSADAIRRLIERGVQVRTHDLLHAKVYVREVAPRPIAWIGSANLTSRGRSGGAGGGNLEAMAGPLLLELEEMALLERWWAEAEPLTLDGLASLEAAASAVSKDDAIRQLVQAAGGVLALQVSFSRSAASFTIPPQWFTVADDPSSRAWRGVGVSVPFVTTDAEAQQASAWSAAYRAVLDGLRDGIAVPVPNGRFQFAVDAGHHGPLADVLPRLNERLALLGSLDQPDMGAEDFTERAQQVIRAHSQDRKLVAEWSTVETGLLRAHDKFTKSRAPRVAFGFSIPLGSQGPDFEQAVESVRLAQGALFTRDPRQAVMQMVGRLDQVIAKHREQS